MNDPREKMLNPFWLQTVTPFGVGAAPGALPPGRPWELPLAPSSLLPAWDSADRIQVAAIGMVPAARKSGRRREKSALNSFQDQIRTEALPGAIAT
jgi:hypothetical protein